jgi:hypothetical protein
MYRVIIVGAGRQGSGADQPNSEKIISFAHAIKNHPEFELTGFIDKDLSKAEEARKKWGAKFASDTLKIVQQHDVAIVATPDDSHYEVLKEIAKKQLSLVICEKPICTELDQAREIVELYKSKGIPILCNYTRRFTPKYNYAYKKSGHKPIYGLCVYNRGFIHSASHALDFFNYIGCENYEVMESKADHRVWLLRISYEDGFVIEESRIGNEPVSSIFDHTMWHLVENAYSFLQGKEPIKCDGEMALRALEKCFELMK